MKLEFPRRIFEYEVFNVKFHENPSSGSQVLPFVQTDGDMTKQNWEKRLQTEIIKYSNLI